MKLAELSLFFPAYNEAENISTTVEKALAVLPKVADKWELLIINDGSKDNTKAVIESLAKKHKGVRAITHPVNRGYGAALKTGFTESKYRCRTLLSMENRKYQHQWRNRLHVCSIYFRKL
jgi:glycosyltransferase involved in cell wall biosynthesis